MYRNHFTFRCLAQVTGFVCALDEMAILSRLMTLGLDKITVLPDFVHRLVFRKECNILNAGAVLVLSSEFGVALTETSALERVNNWRSV